MRAVVLENDFGLANLAIAERETPRPGPDQVLVKVGAVSLNYRDVLLIEGVYNPRQKLPVVPVSDMAGVVEAVGENVTRFRPGDRVLNVFMEKWPAGQPSSQSLSAARGGPGGDGVLADYVAFDEDALLPIPAHLNFSEAATLPCAGLTAWAAVAEHGDIRPGSTVVVEGTGGVALFALQFAKLAGARVMVLSSSDQKLEWIQDLGADEVVNYAETPDWWRTVRERLDPEGADLVIELGGAQTLENALRAVRPGGVVSLIGVLSGAHAPLNLPLVVMRQVRLLGITCGSRADMVRMMAAVEQHGMRPWVHETLPFERYVDAFELLKSGSHVGKVAIQVNDL
ncbi:MAG: NAD(P)-dependent alcohol dehydrogenase [Hyphomicrobiales bacterium]|nr:MAG: NAD(P)-dependent alcohol dehydrogenase [Hyphomicrobiales bacterium]